MAGNVFLKAMETAVGEANLSVPIEFVRSGTVTIQYGVVGDSATAGAELSAPRTHRISILDDETPAPPPPAEPPLVPTHDVTLSPVFDGLSTPVRFIFAPGSTSTVLIAEKAGLLRSVNLQTGAVNTRLDLGVQVNNVTDRGLMDIAIHPDFAAKPLRAPAPPGGMAWAIAAPMSCATRWPIPARSPRSTRPAR